jgi:hypothetical protein
MLPTQAPSGNDTWARPPQPHIPFYKRKKFIVSQLILVPLSIILLFVLLFPVVRAIAQLIVNKSTLNVDVAALSSLQNNRSALCRPARIFF